MGRRRTTNKHLPQRVYLEHGAYYFRPKDGRRVRLGASLSEALLQYAKLVEAPADVMTMNHAFDRYVREALPALAEVTQGSYLRAIGFLRLAFGEISPADIHPRDVYQYMDIRSEAGTKKRSANLERSVLSSVMAKLVIWGIISVNPCKEVKRLRTSSRERLPTWDEIDALCSVAPPLIKVWCALKVATGRRQGELLDLRLSDLRDDGIHFDTSKGGRDVVVAWTDDLRAIIAEAKKLRKGRAVQAMTLFSTRDGSAYTADGFRSIWQRAMTKAISCGALLERFTEHDIRATSATSAREQGVNPQHLLGHRKASTTDIYLRTRGKVSVSPVQRVEKTKSTDDKTTACESKVAEFIPQRKP